MKTPVILDTMTRTEQPLSPADGDTFRFYCCGPTVYGPAHIGNFRTFIIQDILRRVIEASGTKTRHVRNITDVDDKTIRQSQAEGKSLQAFTDFWLERFHADCEALNLLTPHVEPSAVEHIPTQIRMIEQLIDKGHAYVADDGSVYYRVASFDAYGKLSNLPEREITTCAAGCAHTDDEYDRESAADFALWKAHKPEDGPNAWPSPWGDGRPGWHMECSAMSIEYLGESFDLHGGGVDLIFPHHENEIAQSEAATGRPFARIWFHSAHLMVEGNKMSKSLGNLYTLQDVHDKGFDAMVLRYVMLSGHYRQPLNFTWDSLKAAQRALRRLQQLRTDLVRVTTDANPPGDLRSWGPFEPVYNALADNLNTPDALGRLFTGVHEIERRLHNNALDSNEAIETLVQFDAVMHLFGFRFDVAALEAPDNVKQLAEQRWEAKKARDFARADELRSQVTALGWTIRDAKDGYELVRS